MRGTDDQTGALFSYLSPDALVPPDHPLRAIRLLVDAGLERLSPQFSRPATGEIFLSSGGCLWRSLVLPRS